MTRQLKVGIFVLAGLALTTVAVFLIGNTRQLWEPKAGYRTTFHDVAGLKPGAPVRMGGLDVGQVTGVDHGSDPKDSRIFVGLAIERKETPRIRGDSVARVVNKGLLGDKMVELTVGSAAAPQLDPKDLIPSEEPMDMFAAANKMAAVAQEAIEKIQPLAQALGDPKLAEDIKGSASDTHSLLEAMVRGDGTMHRLFYDHAEADRLDELLGNLNRTTARLDATLADVQGVTDQVKKGPGIAHALIYDGEMSKDTAGTLAELHADLKAVREGNGMAHALLYGDDASQHVMANLNAMSDDLRAIVGNMRQGKGTIGALLVDPTVYEDLRSAIGNVERNEVLRALVRYSIKADEQKATPRVETKP
ncbi:MAG TPA: MlaD family protein [Polyangiaceae bacterium]|jgi:phospholipid/cholesterol/gamma-HCH transport system substrate-binding protein